MRDVNALVRTAGVFNRVIPDYLSDDVVVGKVCGVPIHVGEVRRLNDALANLREENPEDDVILGFLRSRRIIEAIKHRRIVSNDGLKEAKDYVEDLAERHGLRRRASGPYGPNWEWV